MIKVNNQDPRLYKTAWLSYKQTMKNTKIDIKDLRMIDCLSSERAKSEYKSSNIIKPDSQDREYKDKLSEQDLKTI